MKNLPILSAPSVFVEIGQNTLTILDGDDALELSLERLDTGRLTSECAERLKESLRVFLKKHSWRASVRAHCAINARGVSLRRLSLPRCGKDELDRLIALQIEREFPLPPAELAWGYRVLKTDATADVLVAAIKRDVLDEYSALLASCGLDPTFTLSALARAALCAEKPGAYALLDIGRYQSEVTSFEQGAAIAVRIVPWGGENLTRAIEQASGLDHAEAEKLKLHLDETAATNGEMSSAIKPAMDRELAALAKSLPANAIGQKLYLSGPTCRLDTLPLQLAESVQVACERLDLPGPEGRSAAILGMRKSIAQNGAAQPLLFQVGNAAAAQRAPRVAWQWVALAIFLAFLSVGLRYAHVFANQPQLARKLSAMRAYRENLPAVERELGFLQFLKTNQPVYIDALSVIANAIGNGTRFDSLSINRAGDVSLRAIMRDTQQVSDFRSKLIDSGFFSNVVVEEQSPSGPDKQKLAIRMSAQWNLGSELPVARDSVEPAPRPKGGK